MPQELAEPVEGGLDELLHVADDALLQLGPVLFALLEQHAQRGVALVGDRRLAAQRPLRPGELALQVLLRRDVGAQQEVAGPVAQVARQDGEHEALDLPGHRAVDLELDAALVDGGVALDELEHRVGEVVADVGGQHLLGAPPEELQRRGSRVHVVAHGADLHGRLADLEEHAAELLRLEAGPLRRAVAGDVAHGADHVGRGAVRADQDDPLVAHREIGAVPAPQAVLAAERTAGGDALPDVGADRVVIVRVHVLEPALEAAGEVAGRHAEQLVELLGEVHGPRLDVPVVEDVEVDAQERLEPRVGLRQRRLRLGAVHSRRRQRHGADLGLQGPSERDRDANARQRPSFPPQNVGLVPRQYRGSLRPRQRGVPRRCAVCGERTPTSHEGGRRETHRSGRSSDALHRVQGDGVG